MPRYSEWKKWGGKKDPPPKKYLLLKWCHFSICDKLKKLQHFKVKLQD